MDKDKSKSKASLLRTISLSPNCAPEEADYEGAPNTDNPSKSEQANVHQFILSEFKEKYDLLKSQY